MSLRAKKVIKGPYLGAQNVDKTLSSVNSGGDGEFCFDYSELELFDLGTLRVSLESSDGGLPASLTLAGVDPWMRSPKRVSSE